ncbi:EAL domain-containing protein [Pseudodesulfovibrio sp. zrk46]|uniref:EAL domain-containing protein n=1 Tax=Pseudodesulfovibrio sp. zrk46 TaxID=2725288 RepID=UPI0014491FBC|nr:EAL domain-containing protein [Pseudodesulfovibrio sp. zrk46]QJB56503.1 EAL domain-containing protein [Pseudodesulfovibrio sp. zrk46]
MAEAAAVQSNERVVKDIINAKSVSTFFQPVVSVLTKSIVGFEAFSRGGAGACTIAPAMLFHDELPPDVKLDVDRLCREKALSQFRGIHQNHKELLIYLNINSDILPHVDLSEEKLTAQVSVAGIKPANVVIETSMCSKHVDLVAALREKFSGLAFKICLDDCSVDDPFSHMISRIKPHFVKVNRSFFSNDERKDYSAKTLEALCKLADRMGASVIAQGVENEEESLRLLAAGVHLQQGYYYTKDENDKTGDPAKMFFRKIIDTHEKFKIFKREMVRRRKESFSNTFKSVASLCAKFSNMPENRFGDACKTLVHNADGVISMFVLDNDGIQITDRSHVRTSTANAVADSILGTHKGAEHSVFDYVMYLDMGYEKFVSPTFSSPYTGQDACIISKPFFNKEGLRYMICIEMPYPG